jgi:hypothetical protein
MNRAKDAAKHRIARGDPARRISMQIRNASAANKSERNKNAGRMRFGIQPAA